LVDELSAIGHMRRRFLTCNMGSGMTPSDRDRAVQRISTQLIEEVGADAVIICFSKTKRNQTTTHLHTWGNFLACRGLAEEAYGHLCEGVESDTEEEDADA